MTATQPQVTNSMRAGTGHAGIVALDDGTRLFVSYMTVIGIETTAQGACFTDKKYTATTTKHRVNTFGFTGKLTPHDEFVRRCAEHGVNAGLDRAPLGF